VAGPSTVPLGETVGITLTVMARCVGEDLPLHVVVVMDASGATQGDTNADLRAGALQLIALLDLAGNPATRVGVVAFNSSATIRCHLTNDAIAVSACVDRVEAQGTASISSGILHGMRVIVEGRKNLEVPAEGVRDVIVLLSAGADIDGCDAAGNSDGDGHSDACGVANRDAPSDDGA